MPGVDLDGNDVLAIHAAAEEAIERARPGGGPTLLECNTYRTRPHAEGMGDFSTAPVRRSKRGNSGVRSPVFAGACSMPSLGPASRNWRPWNPGLGAEVERRIALPRACPLARPAARQRRTSTPNPLVPSQRRPSCGHRAGNHLHASHARGASRRDGPDPSIFVLGEGIGKRGGNFKTTEGLFDLLGPERLCDTPISRTGSSDWPAVPP